MANDRWGQLKGYWIEFPNFLSILIFSMYFLLPSPILLDISKDTGLSTADLSLMFTLYIVGGITGQLTSVFYSRRFERLHIIIVAFGLLIPITLIFLFFNASLILFYILYFLAGYILGLLWIQANANVFESKVKNKDRLTTVALTFYPLGAFFAPIIASSIVKNSLNWKGIYIVLLVLIVITLILYIINGKKMGSAMLESEKNVPISEIFKNKYNNILLVLVTISIITYCLGEAVISTWAPTFYRLARLFDVQEAGFIGSVFWGSIIVGRVIVGFLAGKVRNYIIMLFLAAIAAISIVFAVHTQSMIMIYISIFFTGIGFSGLFPLLVSSGNKHFSRGKDLIATILFAAANMGISLAPFLTRIISENNLIWSLLISSVFMTVTFLLIVGQSLMGKARGMEI